MPQSVTTSVLPNVNIVHATWSYDAYADQHLARLRLDNGAEHEIFLEEDGRGRTVVGTSILFVPEPLRKQGHAGRLFRAGRKLAATYGATISRSHVESPYALAVCRNVYGDDAIKIMDDTAEMSELPITLDQARASLERSMGFPDYAVTGFVVAAALGGVDTSRFEMPYEHNQPEYLSRAI